MKINAHTKISSIIRHNEKSIEAIASINNHFKKLRNPILRKILAPRVTVSDAAKIGNCDIEIIYSKLQDIGFEIENENEIILSNGRQLPVSTLSPTEPENYQSLDVRPILASGTDPFTRIMETLKSLPSEISLKLINSFEPIPLIRILEKKGYACIVERNSEEIITWIKKENPITEKNILAGAIVECMPEEFEKKIAECLASLETIDVRDLDMPGPMIKTLERLETLKKGKALLVLHRKVPKYLFLELQQLQYSVWYTIENENQVKILIDRWNL